MLTVGSLFSGIGGLDLGLEAAGLGPVLWQVEKSTFRRRVLAAHWPDVERFNDVRHVGRSNLAAVDLICGGFPCQDVSSAGARAGLAGERSGLWREFARVVAELRPEWVVVENVASGAGLWFDAVVLELEQQGYDCLPIPLSAFDVGAPHLRKRLFIVAHADRDRQPARAEHAEVVGASVAERPSANTHGQLGDTGASNARKKRTRRSVAAGGAPTDVDGVRPVEQRRREPGTPATIAAGDCAAAADVDGSGREGDRAEALTGRSRLAEDPWGPPVPELLRMADGFSARLDRSRPRIAALGDSVVPQCAEVVGWVIRELIGETR